MFILKVDFIRITIRISISKIFGLRLYFQISFNKFNQLFDQALLLLRKFLSCFPGLLSRLDSKRFDSLSQTIKEEQRPQTSDVDDVFPGASWTRRLGSAVRSFVFQRHSTPVSTRRVINNVLASDQSECTAARQMDISNPKLRGSANKNFPRFNLHLRNVISEVSLLLCFCCTIRNFYNHYYLSFVIDIR